MVTFNSSPELWTDDEVIRYKRLLGWEEENWAIWQKFCLNVSDEKGLRCPSGKNREFSNLNKLDKEMFVFSMSEEIMTEDRDH